MNELSREQVLAEYKERYQAEPTPLTHPELFDPLNPPAGFEYDTWHAFWWRLPTEEQYRNELWVMAISTVAVVVWALWMVL